MKANVAAFICILSTAVTQYEISFGGNTAQTQRPVAKPLRIKPDRESKQIHWKRKGFFFSFISQNLKFSSSFGIVNQTYR